MYKGANINLYKVTMPFSHEAQMTSKAIRTNSPRRFANSCYDSSP